ncbi:DUF6542 domain-containing protein [Prauserella endophytica]|uniref:DUF6542 domain-containing protein n=1 Tax=Prauserella endophytica TaxID=1592324 RepID=A0ABY2RUM6_9PSEU|nr:DUF6542 domain-containing protein [Prauserella endophytica]TKG61323.1 hypothetical protein FCN18_33735 [Prauserella endophytica]
MTAIRDRRSDPDAADDDAQIPWDERAVLGARRGLPWWGAVLLTLGLAVVGAIVDLQVSDDLGVLFQVMFLIGSLAAVAAVQRRNLFGPMVQPPLILAFTVPVLVLTASGLPSSSDTLAKVLAISTPLINAFPMMAITTGLTVALGFYRMYRERDPDAPEKVRAKGTRAEDKRAGDPGRKRGLAKRAKETDDDHLDRPERADRAGKRPPEGRGEPPRRGPGQGGPAAGAAGGRRQRPEDAPRRGRERAADRDAGPGGKPPRDQTGRPRQPRVPPDAAERKRRVEEWPDSIRGPKRPRRTPPPSDEPPGRGRGPRREPGRDERPPRRNRPWDGDRG